MGLLDANRIKQMGVWVENFMIFANVIIGRPLGALISDIICDVYFLYGRTRCFSVETKRQKATGGAKRPQEIGAAPFFGLYSKTPRTTIQKIDIVYIIRYHI